MKAFHALYLQDGYWRPDEVGPIDEGPEGADDAASTASGLPGLAEDEEST